MPICIANKISVSNQPEAGVAFDPSDIANYAVDVDPNSITGFSDGDQVDTFTTIDSGGYTLSQANTANRALWKENIVNSEYAVLRGGTGSGGNASYEATGTLPQLFRSTTNLTIFFVVIEQSINSGNRLGDLRNSEGSARPRVEFQNRVFNDGDVGYNQAPSPSGDNRMTTGGGELTNGNVAILEYRLWTTESKIYVDKVEEASAAGGLASGSITNAYDYFAIMSGGNAATPLDGDLVRAIYYTGQVSGSDRDNLYTYLQDRYQ